MPTITSVTLAATPAPQGSSFTINGSGFGASQGSSRLIFFSVAGNPYSYPFVSSWSDSSITASLPANADITTGGSYFAVQVVSGITATSARSTNFSVGAALPQSPSGNYSYGTPVTAAPGSTGLLLGGGGAPLTGIPVVIPAVPGYPYLIGVTEGTGSLPSYYNVKWMDGSTGTEYKMTPSSIQSALGSLTTSYTKALQIPLPTPNPFTI